MSADLLRNAAKVLRERAEKATSGPWDCEHRLDESIEVNAGSARTQWRTVGPEGRTRVGTAPSSWQTTDRIIEHDADPDFNEPEEIEQRESDADYIATMHPGVGLLVADLLDFTANEHEGDGPEGCWECVRWVPLARLILGREAPS